MEANLAEQMETGRLRELATSEHYLLSVEIAETVQAALDELPEELRTAILLREIEGLSYEEIANGDGMPCGHRAFAHLSRPRGDRQTLTTLARAMRKAMGEQQRRHLSALADGEIDPGSVHPTLSALASNERLVAAWEGYRLIGAAMRSEQIHPEYCLIRARVSERIAAEPVPLQRPRIRWRWTLRLGSLARWPSAPSLPPSLRAPALQSRTRRRSSPKPPCRRVPARTTVPACRSRPALARRRTGPEGQAGPISRQSPETIAGIPHARLLALCVACRLCSTPLAQHFDLYC